MSEAIGAAPAAATAPASTGSESSIESTESMEAADTGAEESQEDIRPEFGQSKAEAKQAAALRKKYQLKVNNKVKELDIDLSDDKEVEKYLQKALAADEKFQEAAGLRKNVEQLVHLLTTNPLAVLKDPALGLDVKALAQQVLNEEIEEMQKSPEQKKIEELEKALKAKEEREKQMEDERTAAQRARMEAEAMQELDDQISEAISTSELPKSPYVIKRVADAMLEAVNMGYTDVTVKQIMPFVEQQITSEISRLFEEAPDQMREKLMEKFVGKKNLDGYRKSKVAKVKTPVDTAKAIKDSGSGSKKAEPKSNEAPIKFNDLFGKF